MNECNTIKNPTGNNLLPNKVNIRIYVDKYLQFNIGS